MAVEKLSLQLKQAQVELSDADEIHLLEIGSALDAAREVIEILSKGYR